MGQEHFSYRLQKDQRIRIFWQGRCIMTLGGQRAVALIQELDGSDDGEVQFILQRVTGNFKRGNERHGRRH